MKLARAWGLRLAAVLPLLACASEPARRGRSLYGEASGGERAPSAEEIEAADAACLQFLDGRGVRYVPGPTDKGIRTPVEITGPLAGVRLTPRLGLPPLMDCELARALVEAAPVLAEAGIDELSYSSAYSYRFRHDSGHDGQLSNHARGLAIDVHVLRGPAGSFDVTRDFEAGAGHWRGLVPQEGDLAGCIGTPATDAGLRLRTLVCRLKHHSAFRVIVTPDDNDDHRDHLHLEAFPDSITRVARVLGVLPLRR
jgi:hypothetical protein